VKGSLPRTGGGSLFEVKLFSGLEVEVKSRGEQQDRSVTWLRKGAKSKERRPGQL